MQNSKNSNNSPGLIIIGLDGATWTVLDPLLKKGLLPTLKKIISGGTVASLESIVPPVTGPAWPVLATGLNPGRLGTYDFVNRQKLTENVLYPVNSNMIRGKAFWDLLSQNGYRSGIFGYPMLIPAYEINGWMVAGLGASKLHKWAWPTSLARELDAVADPYTISISYGLPKYRHNPHKLIDDMVGQFNGQISALEYLLENHPVDVLVAVFGITDVLSHTMWHMWDTSHPMHNQILASNLCQRIEELWQKIDNGIKRLRNSLDPSGHILFVSDHGFGPSWGVFHINRWLEQNGFLIRKKGSAQLNNKLRAKLVENLSPVFQPILRKLVGTQIQHKFRESVLREFDLTQSKAFALETTDVCGMVFINREYARLRNLDESQFVTETVQAIKGKMEGYKQESNLQIEVFLSSDIYHGPYRHLAPELLFKVNDFEVSISYRFADNVYEKRLHNPMKTGNHRQDGIFIGYGPKFQNCTKLFSPISIMDIAPTIMHLLEEAVPASLDGRVAVEALLPGYQEVEYMQGKKYDQPTVFEVKGGNGDRENQEMLQRMKDLGYLD